MQKKQQVLEDHIFKVLDLKDLIKGIKHLEKECDTKIAKLSKEIVDIDRMDILDTMIRTIINGTELPFVDAVLALRRWEHLARSQLSKASGTGQLFSPMILPTDF